MQPEFLKTHLKINPDFIKRFLYVFITFGLFFSNCEKGTNYCDTIEPYYNKEEKNIPDCKFDNPLEDLEWL